MNVVISRAKGDAAHGTKDGVVSATKMCLYDQSKVEPIVRCHRARWWQKDVGFSVPFAFRKSPLKIETPKKLSLNNEAVNAAEVDERILKTRIMPVSVIFYAIAPQSQAKVLLCDLI